MRLMVFVVEFDLPTSPTRVLRNLTIDVAEVSLGEILHALSGSSCSITSCKLPGHRPHAIAQPVK